MKLSNLADIMGSKLHRKGFRESGRMGGLPFSDRLDADVGHLR